MIGNGEEAVLERYMPAVTLVTLSFSYLTGEFFLDSHSDQVRDGRSHAIGPPSVPLTGSERKEGPNGANGHCRAKQEFEKN